MKKIQFFTLLVIFTYLGLAGSTPAFTREVNDLILHFAGYVVLFTSGMIAYRNHRLTVFLFLFLYSVFIEVLQYFIPYRTFSVQDILANLSGLIIGVILWTAIMKPAGKKGEE